MYMNIIFISLKALAIWLNCVSNFHKSCIGEYFYDRKTNPVSLEALVIQ